MNDRFLVDYALSLVGIPYKWGGASPMEGFDCSGVVQEILASVGADPPGDQTAQSLFQHFEHLNDGFGKWGQGSLSFFGENLNKIIHVGFCIDTMRMVEAGGGGSRTLTLQDAINQKAFVRVRPICQRKDFLCVIRPLYRPLAIP